MTTLASRDALSLAPIASARGRIVMPGSKSASIRALLLAAHARGTTRLSNLLDSQDTRVMQVALSRLGFDIRQEEGEVVLTGRLSPAVKKAALDVSNSGLSIRSLLPALAFAQGQYRIFGVARMHERPIGDLVDALLAAGALIDYEGKPGFPPLAIRPAHYAARAALAVAGSASSQFVTGLLLAAPIWLQNSSAPEPIRIDVAEGLISRQYVALTLDLMRRFGVRVEGDVNARAPSFVVAGNARLESPDRLLIEGDASSASYFLALGALAGGPVTVEGVNADSIQPDIGMLAVIEAMGARVMRAATSITVASPGVASGFRLAAIDLDLNHMPDAAMTVAALCMFASGPSRLRNIGSWRVKETDRLSAMAAELAKFGATVKEGADWLEITPPAHFQEVKVSTYDDHRMAMSLALLACGGARVVIENPACVNKTFPEFFASLARLVVPA
jgi:3-phosphoshikimate 1-carboxyvinyltransferase